jgi:hypothetical protein
MPLDDTTYLEISLSKVPPNFRPRRWSKRLDFRPAIWSLRNHPEDWIWDHKSYTIKHKPSNHNFWVGEGFFFHQLCDTRCSCSSDARSSPPLWDKLRFNLAFRAWRRSQTADIEDINRQFASHFLS